MTELSNLCRCCSEMPYEHCCEPFHKGMPPQNALQLMRSRYSAYALNFPDYIIATTHPASPQYSDNRFSWKRSISQFSRNTTFDKLEILDFNENSSLATVTFTAYMTQGGQDATLTERSYFEKIGDRWMYLNGQLAKGYAPQLVKKGPLKILPLAYYGNPILRKKAEPVTEITDSVKTLVEEMIETMDASNGMGLAAPQIHHSIQLFVIRTPLDMESDARRYGDVKVFINPKITVQSDETWSASEGCLSIPAFRSQVERPIEITVEYTTLDGNTVKSNFSGWEARVILHENDHIEGILFIDRLDKLERSKITPYLHQLENRINSIITDKNKDNNGN